MSATSPVIVLLAAGEASRFGSLKQVAPIDGEAMVHRAARHAVACGVPVIVVLGAEAARVRSVLADLALEIVVHEHWRDGLGSSLAAGVRAVQSTHPRASGALLMLADQPRLGTALPMHLLGLHAQAPTRIVATAQAGRAGPPALFPHADFAALAALSGAHGAREYLQREAARVVTVAPDAHAADLLDVDTPADLARAIAPPP